MDLSSEKEMFVIKKEEYLIDCYLNFINYFELSLWLINIRCLFWVLIFETIKIINECHLFLIYCIYLLNSLIVLCIAICPSKLYFNNALIYCNYSLTLPGYYINSYFYVWGEEYFGCTTYESKMLLIWSRRRSMSYFFLFIIFKSIIT